MAARIGVGEADDGVDASGPPASHGNQLPLRVSMVHPNQLDMSLKRLSAALDQLEAAAVRLGKAGAEKRDIEDTLALMQDDRTRLAGDLADALARTQALEKAAEDVGLRLRTAGTTLRRLLATTESGAS